MTNAALTVAMVAERLSASRKKARELIISGAIRGYKVGYRWRVEPADLKSYIDTARHLESEKLLPRATRVPRAKPSHACADLPGWGKFSG
jgi:excisionase family DNA binding protein